MSIAASRVSSRSRASSRTLACLTALLLLGALGACAGPGVVACGPQELFNGEDLSGWTIVNGAPSTWTVRDGMIVCSGLPTGVLRSERMYENFVLEIEYRHMQAGGNAGIFVWSDPLPARGQPFTRSVEVQVLDGTETENYTSHGDVFPIHGSRFVPDRPHPNGWMRSLPSERRGKPAGEWNAYVIRCENGQIDVSLNGARVSGGTESTPRKGYLCLESEGSEVHFRNLRLTELPNAPEPLAAADVAETARGFRTLYNGVDLSGWRAEPTGSLGKPIELTSARGLKSAGSWEAEDWILSNFSDGPWNPNAKFSHLWTDEAFGDYELIADWRWSLPDAQTDFERSARTERPVIGADGKQLVDEDGELVTKFVPDAGISGIYLRGNSKSLVSLWCFPAGSGELTAYRTDWTQSAEVHAGVTPNEPADAPLGEWNRIHITLRGDRLTIVLNDIVIIDDTRLPGLPDHGPIGLHQHGSMIQFANFYIRELNGDGQ